MDQYGQPSIPTSKKLVSLSSSDSQSFSQRQPFPYLLVCVCVCVCVCVLLGFELRDSHLLGHALYHLSHVSSPLCSGYFGDRVLLLAWVSTDHDPLVAGMIGILYYVQLFLLRRGLVHFCPGWPGIIFPISASCIAGMSGTSHPTQLLPEMGSLNFFSCLISNCNPPSLNLPSS
jgi:hypothetical protein